HAGRLLEAPGKRALREAAELRHAGDGCAVVVVLRDPGLAAGDHGILDLTRLREPRERLLPDAMPVDEVHPGHLHRDVYAREASDEIERDIEPRGTAAGHHESLPLARDHQRTLRMHAHSGVAALHEIAVGPMRGGIAALEQPGLGEEQRTRTGRSNSGAGRVAPL